MFGNVTTRLRRTSEAEVLLDDGLDQELFLLRVGQRRLEQRWVEVDAGLHRHDHAGQQLPAQAQRLEPRPAAALREVLPVASNVCVLRMRGVDSGSAVQHADCKLAIEAARLQL